MSKLNFTPLFSDIREERRFAQLDERGILFYLMLQPQLDAFGRINSDVTLANANVWPLLRRSDEQTRAAMDACADIGLLDFHELQGVRWIQCVDWENRQATIGRRRDRPASRFPEPSDSTRIAKLGDVSEASAQVGHALPPTSTDTPLARARARSVDASEVASESDASATRQPPSRGPRAKERAASTDTWEHVIQRPEYAAARNNAAFMSSWQEWIDACAEHSKGGRPRSVPHGKQAAKMLNQAIGRTPELVELKQPVTWHLARYGAAIASSILHAWASVDVSYLDVNAIVPATTHTPPQASNEPATEFKRAFPTSDERDTRSSVQHAWIVLADARSSPSDRRRSWKTLVRFAAYFIDLKPADRELPVGDYPEVSDESSEVAA